MHSSFFWFRIMNIINTFIILNIRGSSYVSTKIIKYTDARLRNCCVCVADEKTIKIVKREIVKKNKKQNTRNFKIYKNNTSTVH